VIRAIFLVLGISVPAFAAEIRGELCFPFEGWALVSHWHVGTTVRSKAEGWERRMYGDRGWDRVKAGALVPQGESAVWLRQEFAFKRSLWRDLVLVAPELPSGSRMFLNGTPVGSTVSIASGTVFAEGVALSSAVRSGMNVLCLVLPPGPDTRTAPSIELKAIARSSGRLRSPGRIGVWRVRADRVATAIPPEWLKTSDTSAWGFTVDRPPVAEDGAIPRAPYCLKTVLDVPHYWRNRRPILYLHGIPGSPTVYLNGNPLTGRLSSPARFDLTGRIRYNGRDVLCLVYDEPPRAAEGSGSAWGMAAIYWDQAVGSPRFLSGTTLYYDAVMEAGQPGFRAALTYVEQVLATGSTPFDLHWEPSPYGAGADVATTATVAGRGLKEESRAQYAFGLVVAAWSASPFRAAEREPALKEAERICSGYRARSPGAVWMVTQPTAGGKPANTANGRLLTFNRDLTRVAGSCGARPVPGFDVFRSALRRQRRWPARPDFSDAAGRLTPHGSYLLAIAILETLALP
jgi:hypothetical protein